MLLSPVGILILEIKPWRRTGSSPPLLSDGLRPALDGVLRSLRHNNTRCHADLLKKVKKLTSIDQLNRLIFGELKGIWAVAAGSHENAFVGTFIHHGTK